MALIETSGLISVSEANSLGISRLVRDAEEGQDRVLLRNNRAVAAVVSMDRFERLQRADDLEADMIDLTLTLARLLTTGPVRHSLDDVLTRYNVSRADIAAMDE
jgi:antitoxin (DNA-binding transcriptional repressor) of toxin-antitoxin stability system